MATHEVGRHQRGGAGKLSHDAHMAVLALEHGATMVSFDRDFERFAGLRFELLQG